MLLYSDGDKVKNTENIWLKNVFFGNQKGEFTIFKQIFQRTHLFIVTRGQFLR